MICSTNSPYRVCVIGPSNTPKRRKEASTTDVLVEKGVGSQRSHVHALGRVEAQQARDQVYAFGRQGHVGRELRRRLGQPAPETICEEQYEFRRSQGAMTQFTGGSTILLTRTPSPK